MDLRFTRSLFCLNLFWAAHLYAQRTMTSFGQVSDLALDYSPNCVIILNSPSSPPEIVVASRENSVLSTYRLDRTARIVKTSTIPMAQNVREMRPLNLHGNDGLEIFCFGVDGALTLVSHNKKTEYHAPEIKGWQRCAVADLNNDRRPDLLFFGKNSSGASTLLATPKGTYEKGPILFQDFSVADLAAFDLNGDGISDILILNWLADQLSVFYGIGRTVYSEQVTIDLPGEPAEIAIAPVNRDHSARVAVTIPEKGIIAVLDANATGDFELAD